MKEMFPQILLITDLDICHEFFLSDSEAQIMPSCAESYSCRNGVSKPDDLAFESLYAKPVGSPGI
ncbi:hypothetical protein BPAE_0056g00470 [Botrytis paeoniae]|uniref:Uncharacterized protein n=1 Tax=Botrytis paeoniae TaxID=278948 RepID=A0A4Z1FQ72_9HELO|nr:hypothetical protein BPAE_0056g00470 [Botrytis paeoniae]